MARSYGIRGYENLVRELEDMKKAPQKVLDKTLADVRTRVPSWVSAEVSQVYGIKKKEIGDGKTSTLKIKGKKLPDVKLVYEGRYLTHTHFKMTPTAPKAGAYTLKATLIKGQRSTIGKVKKLSKKQRAAMAKNFRREGTRRSDHSPVMLMPTGNRRVDGVNYIPFQRKSTRRNDVQAVKWLSVPQMIENEKVRPNIQRAIDEGIGKRLDHYLQRYMGE